MSRQSAPLSLEHILLAMLDSRPMHGYELYQELSQAAGISMIWNITQSLLYVMLDRLAEKRYIAFTLAQSDTHPPRKIFELTSLGAQQLRQWMKTPVRRARQMRQEFLAKLIVTRRYGPEAALELIRLQKQACQTWMDQLQADFPPDDAAHRDAWLVATYRLQRLESIIKWLALCEAEFIGEQHAA